jgi:peptidyl-prolyl cis-trans isomerase D
MLAFPLVFLRNGSLFEKIRRGLMLLSLMRKHAKSWLIKFLIGMIAVVFIFYFGYSFTSREGVKIAYVNGEVISGSEYQKVYRNLLERLQREYKKSWSDKLVDAFDLKNVALQSLINEKLISQEAKRMGLDVTENEIQKEILSYPAFQFIGRFDETRYRSLLQQNRMKPEDFEAVIARSLLQKKLDQFLKIFQAVSEQEVLDHYRFTNQKIKISFVRFSPDELRESIAIDETSMVKYFDEHREKYRIPEKVKIAYIVVDPEEFRDEDKVRFTEQQVTDYYEENLEMFREKKEVKARHILFKLSEDASEEEEKKAREKGLKVLKKARQGEDFSALAQKYSEGPTGKNGGELGYFSSGQMVESFEEAAFKMKKGEISDLVRTPFGYHIVKLDDIKEARTRDLDQVREQIEETLIHTVSADLAHEKALSLIDQMPYDVDLSEYASDNNVPIKQSGYFSQNEPIPDIGDDTKIRELIFSLGKNDVSEMVESDGKFYIIQIVDRKASSLPELDEMRDKLKDDYESHLAVLKAKSAAERYLDELNGGKPWDVLAEENNLNPEMTEFFTRNETIPQIGYDKELQEAAFSLGENKRYPDKIFVIERGVFVVRWEGKEEIDEGKYKEEKEGYLSSLMLEKHKAIYGEWLQNLRERAEIRIVNPVSDSEP